MTFWDYVSRSTLKREVAVVLMLWLLGLSTWYAVAGGPPQAWQVIGLFALPIGVIFAGAFGLDWIAKQTTIAGPPMGPPPRDLGPPCGDRP